MKYEFTGEVKNIGGKILHRICAVRDIPEHNVKAGDLGGWIEAERNLSQKGAAWVADSALVMDSARVTGKARVMDSARVTGKALVMGSAWVTGSARVMGEALVMDSARVTGKALVTDSADYIAIGAIGSRDDTTTFCRGKDRKIYVSCGCFNGTIDDFAAEVKQVHAGTKHERTYLLAIELAKAQIATEEENDG